MQQWERSEVWCLKSVWFFIYYTVMLKIWQQKISFAQVGRSDWRLQWGGGYPLSWGNKWCWTGVTGFCQEVLHGVPWTMFLLTTIIQTHLRSHLHFRCSGTYWLWYRPAPALPTCSLEACSIPTKLHTYGSGKVCLLAGFGPIARLRLQAKLCS